MAGTETPAAVAGNSPASPARVVGAGEVPETLIVSWHWPPTNRASTGVLASLLGDAPSERFRVLTRQMPPPAEDDRTAAPPLETHVVPWRLAPSGEGTLAEWRANVRALLHMLRGARSVYRTRPFERVVAVYPHRFSLLTGWWIARLAGVPLVAYMHDLFAESYRSGSWGKRTFWGGVDRRALREAALVVVPTEEFAAHYGGRGVARTLVLPHCVPAGESSAPLPRPKRVLDLVYAGNLYAAHEDAIRAFLAASDSLGDIRVTLLTPPHPMLGQRPARWASRTEALRAVRAADVGVVVLGHDTPYPDEVHGCFPSKIVDYLTIGRPMLALVPPGCFVDRFLRASGTGVVVNTLNPADIRSAIEQLHDADLRARLADAAPRAAGELRAELHLPRFLRALATLGADQPAARLPGRIKQPDGRRISRLPCAAAEPQTTSEWATA